jgi:hypothetical protein
MHPREPLFDGDERIESSYWLLPLMGEAVGPPPRQAKSGERAHALSLLWNAIENLVGEAVSFLPTRLA